MIYKNTKTGAEVVTTSVLGGAWVRVDNVPKEEKKPEAKKPVKKKATKKKG